jgi:hypothetical protein
MDEERIRVSVNAEVAIAAFPPSVQRRLLDNAELMTTHGLEPNSFIKLVGTGATFPRSALFSAVRKVLSAKRSVQQAGSIKATDTKGKKHSLFVVNRKGVPIVEVSVRRKRARVRHFALLSDDPHIRQTVFKSLAVSAGLRSVERDAWMKRLRAAPVSDDDVSHIQADLDDNPEACENAVREIISRGRYQILELIPLPARYFERLVGPYRAELSLEQHLKQVTVPFIQDLINERGLEGAKHAALLCAQPYISEGLSSLKPADIAKLLNSVFRHPV